MSKFKKIITILLMFSLIFIISCSSIFKNIAIQSTTEIINDGFNSFMTEEDINLAHEAMASNLKLLETLLQSDPENEKLLLMLCKAYCGYTFGFVEDPKNPDPELAELSINRAKKLYIRGRDYGLKILKNKNPEFKKIINGGFKITEDTLNNLKEEGFDENILKPLIKFKDKEFETKKEFEYILDEFKFSIEQKDAILRNSRINYSYDEFEKSVKNFNKENVPALFWTAYNWGNFINLSKDDPESIADLGRVEIMMKRVMELDEKYYYGGVFLFYVVYYAGRPTMLGGNPEKAEEYYKKCKQINEGKFLMLDVMFAQYYATQTNNKQLYLDLLNKVIETPSDILPEEILTNEIAKHKAKNLIKIADEIFVGEETPSEENNPENTNLNN